MSSSYNILVTGANRGLGLGLVKLYLARPNTTVIAAVRDPASSSAQALHKLTKDASSSLIPIRIDSISDTDPTNAATTLQKQHDIRHIDLVIANAGIATSFSKVSDVKIEDLHQHMEVNVYGAVRLYQAMLPLLDKAEAPKWVSMSSIAGSLAEMVSVHNVQYGMSKAALNFVTAKIHSENQQLTTFAVHPGWVQTELGNRGAVAAGLSEAPDSLQDSCLNVQKVIDAAARDSHGGKFWWHDGSAHPW